MRGTAIRYAGMGADMDCQQFRTFHLAYLDDTLPGTQMADAQRHVLHCDACAAHDTLVRRSLMIARNMPAIEPTPAFQRRLRERLAACRRQHGRPWYSVTGLAVVHTASGDDRRRPLD